MFPHRLKKSVLIFLLLCPTSDLCLSFSNCEVFSYHTSQSMCVSPFVPTKANRMESDPEAGNGSDPPPQAPAASSSVSGDTAAATAGASRPAAVRRGTDSGSGMVERDERSTFSKSKDYSSFRSSISQRQVLVRHQQREYRWRLYDHGPKSVRTPLLLLPPVSGTADVWYQQMLPLACQGFRCIALDYPLVDSVPESVAARPLLDSSLGSWKNGERTGAAVLKRRQDCRVPRSYSSSRSLRSTGCGAC